MARRKLKGAKSDSDLGIASNMTVRKMDGGGASTLATIQFIQRWRNRRRK
mgnify:CR=1 FL=1